MSNVSSVVNYFATANEGFNTTLGSTITSGASTVPLAAVTGLVNGTIFVGIIEPGATNQQVFTGTVDTGGSQVTGVVWTRGTNVGHVTGVTIVDYVTGTGFNMITAGILKQHTQAGAHHALTNTGGMTTDNFTYTGTFTAAAGTIAAAALAGSIPYSKLLSTIFSSQVLTQANAGTGGGTMSYVNLGGIKLLWVITSVLTSSAAGSAGYTVTLPTSFFSTITYASGAAINMVTDVRQYAPIQSATATTITFALIAPGAATTAASILIIGT